jgi:hypothetical protein
MPRALKVFRTAAGFHDAYVATTSRKAALEAWGADVDLFSRGVAEQVTDEALMTEPLKRPGEVIMKSRGGLADQLKALGPKKKPRKKADAGKSRPPDPRKGKPPTRERLDNAEGALDEASQRHAAARARLEKERDAIERKLAALEATQANELARLKQRRDAAREAYREALDRWSE